MAKCVEELSVYRKARAASTEVSALILRPEFDRDLRLRSQLGASSERVASLISEGFEQSTDRYFAQYCYRSKGSCAEMRTQLGVARDRKYISESERARLDAQYEEIAKMLSGLIDHLERDDWKHRRQG
jgi:four helix bundle protein